MRRPLGTKEEKREVNVGRDMGACGRGWGAQHGHLALSRLHGERTCICLFDIHSYLTIRVSKMTLNVISLLFLTYHCRTL